MVTLWIENSEWTVTLWQDRIAFLKKEASEAKPPQWSKEEYVRFTLADDLKDWMEEAAEQLGLEAGILNEYISGGIEETDWHLVARNLIEE